MNTQQITRPRKRTEGKLATTTYVGEVIDFVDKIRPTIETGQDDALIGRIVMTAFIDSVVTNGGTPAFGFYTIKFVRQANPDPSSDVARSDFGTDGTVVEALLINPGEVYSGGPFVVNDVVQCVHYGTATLSGTRYDVFVPLQSPSGDIPVTLTKTSGIDGTSSAAPTYLYTATDRNGKTVGTSLAPAHNRPIGKTIQAGRGSVVYVSGSPVLWDTDEKPNFALCGTGTVPAESISDSAFGF